MFSRKNIKFYLKGILFFIASSFFVLSCSKKSQEEQYVVSSDFNEEDFIMSEIINESENDDNQVFESAKVPDISLFKYELTETGDGLIITEYNGTEISNLKFPDEIEGFPVVQIKIRSYQEQINEIKTIVFPDSIKSLEGCKLPESIENIHLPEALESIPSLFFANCNKLKKIIIPNNVKKIERGAFEYTEITSLIIPNSVEEIDKEAFLGAHYLQNIKLSSNLKIIGSYVFSKCFSLKSIDIPEGVTEIPSSAFESCVLLESINFPTSLKTIGSSAFSGCYSLKTLSLPDGLESLIYTFGYNREDYFNERSKIILENIIQENFMNLDIENFESIDISDIITDIQQGKTGLVSLEIPDTVTNLCTFPDKTLNNLEYLKLPNTLKEIKNDLFGRWDNGRLTKLKCVVLPTACEKINDKAFYELPLLEKIEIPESITQIEFSYNEKYSETFAKTNLNLTTQARLRKLGYKGSF